EFHSPGIISATPPKGNARRAPPRCEKGGRLPPTPLSPRHPVVTRDPAPPESLHPERDRDLHHHPHGLVAVPRGVEAHDVRHLRRGLVQVRITARLPDLVLHHPPVLVDPEQHHHGAADPGITQQRRVVPLQRLLHLRRVPQRREHHVRRERPERREIVARRRRRRRRKHLHRVVLERGRRDADVVVDRRGAHHRRRRPRDPLRRRR